MSHDAFARRFAIDGLIAAPGAAVRPDGTLPGRRPLPRVMRRRHDDNPPRNDEDTVTLHDPAAGGDDADADLVERLRRRGYRKSP
jgi:hypothetical protein